MKRNIGAENGEISNIGRVLYPSRVCPWSRIFTLLLGIALIVACSGCAVIVSRDFYEYRHNPRPYPSVRSNFGYPEWPLKLKADGFDVAFDFSKPISLLILPVDLPISIVVDTVLMPMDLMRWRTEVVNQRYVSNALSSENMPSAEEFRKNYIRLYSEGVIWRYLVQPPDKISQTRLDMLLNAGVSPSLMAKSNLMNEDFANRLMDRILFEPPRSATDWGYDERLIDNIKTLLQNKMIPPAILKRMAGLGNKKLLPLVAADERTPPDVLRTLSEDDSCNCRWSVAGNSSSPPDVLSKLADNPEYVNKLLGNKSTPADALLKMIPSMFITRLSEISRHPNATPAVDDAIIKVGKQMFAKVDLSSDERSRINYVFAALAEKDLPRHNLLELAVLPLGNILEAVANNRNADANILITVLNTCRKCFAKGDLSSDERDGILTALAQKKLPHDKLLELAVLPLPRMLNALSQNKNADADTLTTILNTCRKHKLDPNFESAILNAQFRLENPDEGLNIKAEPAPVKTTSAPTTPPIQDAPKHIYDVNELRKKYKPQILQSGLVAYYPFNGNAKDESGNLNNGTVFGAILAADRHGIANSAYRFNGNNGYIDCGNAQILKIADKITISVWININGNGTNWGRIVLGGSVNTSYTLCKSEPEDGILWRLTGVGEITSSVLDRNKWHHVVASYDGVKMSIYIDGNLNVSSYAKGNINTNSKSIVIGGEDANHGDRSSCFDGVIDEVRIYNRTLLPEEIFLMYKDY